MLTVPEGLILQEATQSPVTFNKQVYFASNVRTIDPLDITVNRLNSTSYSFGLAVQLLLGEVISLHTDWIAQGQMAGSYNLTVVAFSNDPDVDPRFRSSEDTCEVQIVEDSPAIGEIVISPVYYPPFDPQTMYVSSGQAVQVRCNVTCLAGISAVTLYYSVDSSGTWNQSAMMTNLENEWIGDLPEQSEGEDITLYLEAFSAMDKSARTKEYTITVSDLQGLELKATIATAATVTTIIVGCALIFIWKRRKIIETL